MTQPFPCLLSIGKVSSKVKHFPFICDQVKIGRAADVTYTILSPLISRCHVVIDKQADGTWTITDNKSLNGTAVNGIKLSGGKPQGLQDGDTVQLGIPLSEDIPAQFVYRFFSSLKVRREPRSKPKRPHDGKDNSPAKASKIPKLSEGVELHSPQRNLASKNCAADDPDTAPKSQDQDEKLKALYEEQLEALAQQLQAKEQEKSLIAQQLEQERQERQVIEERQKQQEERVCQLDAKQRQLVKEQEAAEEQMRRELEERLRRQEALLRDQMQAQLATLATERQQVEERLQQEMEKAVQEKDRQLQDRLTGEKERLNKIIETKELEQKALESQLAESRVENEKVKATTLTTKEALLSEFADVMETELQCSICNELFIKATSLNCSHAFCALCIRQWLAVKRECPNCRTPVSSQMHSIVLDNYIDRMVEQLSSDLKERRANLVAERKVAEAQMDETQITQTAGPSTAFAGRGRVRQRARGRGRGQSRGRGVQGGPAPPLPTLPGPRPPAHRTAASANSLTATLRAIAEATTTAAIAAASRAAASRAVATTAARAAVSGTQPSASTAATTSAEVQPVGATVTVGTPDVVETLTHDSVDAPAADNASPNPILVTSDDDDDESEVITDSDESFYDGYDQRNRGRRYWSDEDDASNSEDEDGDGYMSGTGAYYGGYGRCYSCGMRGHWANGCPNQ